MNRELLNRANELDSKIKEIERDMRMLRDDEIEQIDLCIAWPTREGVSINPSAQLASKVCGLIHQELEGRLGELKEELEAL